MEEKKKCREILQLLSLDELSNLVKTSSKGMITVDTRKEAIEAIVTCSESAREILNRRKITREVLAKYLLSVGEPIPNDPSKGMIIERIIGYWNRSYQRPPDGHFSPPQTTKASSDVNVRSLPSSRTPPVSPPVSNVYHYNPTFVAINYHVHNPQNSPDALGNSADQSSAEAFISWFFEMLNSFNPIMGKPQADFGPHHFFDDVVLNLVMATATSEDSEQIFGNVPVAQRFLVFPQELSLLFNPNVTKNGVMVKTDPHGPKMILVCGTLHKDNTCVGIFQQSFGLISDPKVKGSWKVKVTCLKMQHCVVSASPSLQDCGDVIKAIEDHTLRALQHSS